MRKHSVTIDAHKTSYSIEDPFFDEIRQLAREQNISIASLVRSIDHNRNANQNLSSALRVFVLNSLQEKLKRNQTLNQNT